ncbi:MAG: hypothetical protein ACK53Y_06275, partial [bacterium]
MVRPEPPFERGVLLERAIEVRPSAILHRLPRGPDNLVGDGIHCVGQPLRESTEPVYRRPTGSSAASASCRRGWWWRSPCTATSSV